MTDKTTTTDPADVAELLRWARESRGRPAMAETTAGCIRRLEAENERLRERGFGWKNAIASSPWPEPPTGNS
jgi:hypothetical protein